MGCVTNYKWELRKGGRKLICPKCGQRRFVPYVSALDHATLAGAEFGRCDREQNCGYQMYPNGKETPDVEAVEIKREEPLRFYPAAVRTDIDTNLFKYVCSLLGMAHALAIWQRYKIGKDGERTVFWQIAKDGTIRAGKSIPYGTDGHRIKTDKYPANWLHKCKRFDGFHTGKELQQCYFGEHLLNIQPNAPVVIVESEKTAAIMSEYSQSHIWLASGGSQGLKNEEKNAALKGRDVLLIPDHGQYWAWAQIANANGWDCTDVIERHPCFSGCDILDMVEAGMLGNNLLKYQKK